MPEISFSEEEFKELLKMAHIGTSILGILGDYLPDEYEGESDKMDLLEKHILKYAEDFGFGNLAESYKGETILKDKVYEDMNKIIDDYDDFIFWDELETRLGHRDLARDLTEEEKKKLKEDIHFMVEKTEEYFQKYRDEFEKYGIERLEIKKDK